MSVTIYEIAERAGVSSSTVARILRGEDRKSYRRSAETAERVRQIARELGYRPNLRARAFSRGRTRGIGLLYTDDAWIFEGVNTKVVNSLVRALQSEGHHLVFCPIDDRGDWQEIVLGGQIDGGVVFQILPVDVMQAVRDRHLPLVLLGDNSDPTLSQVVVDDFAGAFAATKYLIGLGHRRVMLFVHEAVKPHCSIQERLRGYQAAMAEAELPTCEQVRVHEGTAIDMLARGPNRATAVLCYSDLESTLLVHGLWQVGLTVPGDVSLIGFNDVFATEYMTPPLSTVGFDAARIGELGARQVLKDAEVSEDTRQPNVQVIHPKLIVRGSTGPVRTADPAPRAARAHSSTVDPSTTDGKPQ
jgi:LacI family transcriptional regulator, galactose operon repressor